LYPFPDRRKARSAERRFANVPAHHDLKTVAGPPAGELRVPFYMKVQVPGPRFEHFKSDGHTERR